MSTDDTEQPAPSTSDARPAWQLYERLIAQMIVHDLTTDLCVTANARVRGHISDTPRQIDVLIDARHATDNSRRIIVDAKKHRRKIDVQDVESFEGLMKDVRASHGYLVSPSGHTKAAEKRAQEAISLSLVPLEHVELIDPTKWPRCLGKQCASGRVFWDGFPEFFMSLIPLSRPDAAPQRMAVVHYVGKCDRCGRFHINCLRCGDIFSLNDSEGPVQCTCKLPWYWWTSIERDAIGEVSCCLPRFLTARDSRYFVTTRDRNPGLIGEVKFL